MVLQVIEVNLTSEAPQEIAAGKTYRFSYSVEWTQTDKQYEDRFSRYLDYSYVPPPRISRAGHCFMLLHVEFCLPMPRRELMQSSLAFSLAHVWVVV